MSSPGEIYGEEQYTGPLTEKLGDFEYGADTQPEYGSTFKPAEDDLVRMAITLYYEAGIEPERFLIPTSGLHKGALKIARHAIDQRNSLAPPNGMIALKAASTNAGRLSLRSAA